MGHKRCWCSDVEQVCCRHGRIQYDRNASARAAETVADALATILVRVSVPWLEGVDACDCNLRRRHRHSEAHGVVPDDARVDTVQGVECPSVDI